LGNVIGETRTAAIATNVMLAMTLSIYIVVAVYSVVFSYRRLNRPGVSKEVRELFFKKHFYYVAVFTIIWALQQSSNFYHLFNPTDPAFEPVNDAYSRARSRSMVDSISHLELLAEQLGFRPLRETDSGERVGGLGM
jgi:hypothetical protein